MRGLERIALHQTRLRLPGLALDPGGVALGTRGLVLLPSIERLVAFLSIYTREHSFAELVGNAGDEGGFEIAVVRSALATREIVVSFAASSTALLDLVADVARLAGGQTFTGGGRYYVQYRDRTAPFGYDVQELLRAEQGVDFALHHTSFTQAYARERPLDLRALVTRLEPRPDPRPDVAHALPPGRPLWLVAEPGVAAPLVAYFARHGVEADVGVVELPPASSFEGSARRVALFRIQELPTRLVGLVLRTPGIRAYAPVGIGVAVEVGFVHPVHLSGLPIFPDQGIVLLPGRRPRAPRTEPLVIDPLPTFGPVSALAAVTLEGQPVQATGQARPASVTVPLRLSPAVGGTRQVTASILSVEHAALLRRLAYALPESALEAARLARVRLAGGADLLVLRAPVGVENVPLGSFFSERAPGLFVLAGHDLLPACTPSHLAEAVGASLEELVFVHREPGDPAGHLRVFRLPASAFVPLGQALVEPESWGALLPAEVVELAAAELDAALVDDIVAEPLGLAPLRGVER